MVHADQHVEEAMQCFTTDTADIISTRLPTDRRKEELILEFMTSVCGCTKVRGMQCCQQFSVEYVRSSRECCAELSHSRAGHGNPRPNCSMH